MPEEKQTPNSPQNQNNAPEETPGPETEEEQEPEETNEAEGNSGLPFSVFEWLAVFFMIAAPVDIIDILLNSVVVTIPVSWIINLFAAVFIGLWTLLRASPTPQETEKIAEAGKKTVETLKKGGIGAMFQKFPKKTFIGALGGEMITDSLGPFFGWLFAGWMIFMIILLFKNYRQKPAGNKEQSTEQPKEQPTTK